MTAINNTPTNTNFLSPLGFRFQIKKAPHINFFVQSVSLPSLQLGEATVPTPFVRVPMAGDHMTFGDFNLTFKVDESMKSYLEIFNWIVGIGKPNSYQQYKDLVQNAGPGEGVYSDITLTVLSSSMRPIHEIIMVDAFPVSLTEMVFDSRMSDVDYLEATASFRFREFTITSL